MRDPLAVARECVPVVRGPRRAWRNTAAASSSAARVTAAGRVSRTRDRRRLCRTARTMGLDASPARALRSIVDERWRHAVRNQHASRDLTRVAGVLLDRVVPIDRDDPIVAQRARDLGGAVAEQARRRSARAPARRGSGARRSARCRRESAGTRARRRRAPIPARPRHPRQTRHPRVSIASSSARCRDRSGLAPRTSARRARRRRRHPPCPPSDAGWARARASAARRRRSRRAAVRSRRPRRLAMREHVRHHGAQHAAVAIVTHGPFAANTRPVMTSAIWPSTSRARRAARIAPSPSTSSAW